MDQLELFQQAKLKELKEKDFATLAALPNVRQVDAPDHLRSWRFYVCRTDAGNGAIRINFEAKRRMLLIFETAFSSGFEMLPNGTIVEDEPLEGATSSEKNPRQSPVDAVGNVPLPADIEHHILRYLLLEYGESQSDPTALKLTDLVFEGEHVVDGVPTLFWSYPTGKDRLWATVEQINDTYCLSMADKGPNQTPGRKRR